MTDFSIEIEGRGEEVRYVEQGKAYIFDVSFACVPYRLYAGDFWDPELNARRSLQEKQRYIVERLAKWLSRDGKPAVIDWEIDVSRQLPPKIASRAEWVDPRQHKS